MWRDLFYEHILERGLDYFIRNLVENIYIEENRIRATVHGTEEYEVEIVKEDEEIVELNCDCPYADSGENCKHMAAVLFYLEGKNKLSQAKDMEKDIIKLVEEADTRDLKNFLVDILKYDEKLINKFKNRLGSDILPSDMERYKRQVNNIFSKYAGYDDFVDYNNAWGFISSLEEILDNDIGEMLENNQLEEAFELTNYVFIRLAGQDMDDSDGGVSEIASSCFGIWEEILDKSTIELKIDIYQWFNNRLDGTVVDYMEDYIEEIIFLNFKEEEFMKRKLMFIDKKIEEYKKEENSLSKRYRLGQMLLRRIDIMEEMSVNQDTIEDYCRGNLKINEVRKYYINICIDKKDYDKAIELLKEGKEIEKDWPGLVLDYSLKLKDLYKERDQDKLYKEELWLLVLDYDKGDLDLYKELKLLYSDEEWIDKREIILGDSIHYTDLGNMYELEGLYDRLLDLVINSYGLYTLMRYEDILKDIYPKELLDKYEKSVEEMARNTSGRARYREIVSILKRMKKYPDGKERIIKIVGEWRTKYKNRPAMMDELNKL